VHSAQSRDIGISGGTAVMTSKMCTVGCMSKGMGYC